jgi:hypothetical protein
MTELYALSTLHSAPYTAPSLYTLNLSSLFLGKIRESSVSLIFFFLGPVYRPEGPVDKFMAAANAASMCSMWRHDKIQRLAFLGGRVHVSGLGSRV